MFSPSLMTLEKNRGCIKPQLIGKNKATIFYGFCQKHDSEIFRPIESRGYEGDEIQNFLFGYRAVARELYVRIKMGRLLLDNFQNGNVYFGGTEDFLKGFFIGTRDLIICKSHFDKSIINKDYADIKYYRITVNSKPNILVSSIFKPEYTVGGLIIQDPSDLQKVYSAIQINVFPNNKSTEILFTWHKKQNKEPQVLIDSIKSLNEKEKFEVITNIIFNHCENLVISPDWWTNISEDSKQNLLKIFNESVDIMIRRDPNYLKPKGLNIFT